MQPRTLDAIISELNPTYEPQIQSLRARQADIPNQIAAEETGLQAKQQNAFGDILSGARRRGLGFSGIPLGEQAQYTATEYLPALARLRQTGREQQMGLEDAILGISERRNTLAQQLRQQEIDRAEQQRQFNESLAEQQRSRAASSAASNSFSPSYGGGGGSGAPTSAPKLSRKQDGGFAFSDAGGAPISAAKYAQMTGQPLGTVLQQMGQAGDKYAATLYNQLANDRFFQQGDQNYLNKIKQAYAPIFWGT